MLKKIQLTNEQYDRLKKVAFTFAPIATFIGAICVIWGVPFAEQITATLAAFDTLLGSLLRTSTTNYKATKLQDSFNSEDITEMMDEGEYYADEDETAEQ